MGQNLCIEFVAEDNYIVLSQAIFIRFEVAA